MADSVRVQFSASVGVLIKGVEDARASMEKMRSPGAAQIRNARAPGPQGGERISVTTVPIRERKWRWLLTG